MPEIKPIRTLECCCCGESTRGRQWPNRDMGYGICLPCVAYAKQLGQTDAEILSNYGTCGVHYGVVSELTEELGKALAS